MPFAVELQRLGYRAAFRALQVYWLLRRPDQHGVKCLLTDRDDRVLLVRHTYGSRAWDLPGGSLKRGEPPVDAARREMEEELGVRDAPWRPLGEIRGGVNRRRDTIHIFGAEVDGATLTPNAVELAATAWFDRGRLPLDTGPYLGPILTGVATPTQSSPGACS